MDVVSPGEVDSWGAAPDLSVKSLETCVVTCNKCVEGTRVWDVVSMTDLRPKGGCLDGNRVERLGKSEGGQLLMSWECSCRILRNPVNAASR